MSYPLERAEGRQAVHSCTADHSKEKEPPWRDSRPHLFEEGIMAHDQFQRCIESCVACARECERCGDACIGSIEMAGCVRTCRDCTALCWVCTGFMSRESALAAELCRACAKACVLCAAECGEHEAEHCKRCAEACRLCAEECRQMAA